MSFEINFFFVFTLLICVLLSKLTFVQSLSTKFYQQFSKRAFPTTSVFEPNKFIILRVLFGLVLLLRGLDIHHHLLVSEYFSEVGLWVAAEMIAGVFIIFGLFTQWMFVFLMAMMWHMGDKVVMKSTLGNDIAAMLATLLMLVNAGKYISVDHFLMKRCTMLRKFLLYYDGTVTQEGLFYAKFSTLAAYTAVCIYSICMHLNEPAWIDGSAGPLLLSNNFMSRPHEIVSQILTQSSFAVLFAKISIWVMMLWYPAVLLFVMLGGFLRSYVIIWGWLFFALSLFVLQLGYLAELEMIFWLGLFWSSVGMNQKNSLSVMYDDRCNLCDKTIQVVTFLDIFSLIKLKPLSKNKQLLKKLNISEQQALTDLYGYQDGSNLTFSGYDFYIKLSKTLVLLWPFYPLLVVGKVCKIGPMIYSYIAKRRTEMFGVCVLPREKYTRVNAPLQTSSTVVQATTLHILFLISIYLLAIPIPQISLISSQHVGAKAAHIYGITPINVFNKTDLRMAENWFVLQSQDFSETVPLLGEDGSRLKMHASDRVYFGHTLRFRRSVINNPTCAFKTWENRVKYLTKIYLQQKNAPQGNYQFTYHQKFQKIVSSEKIAVNTFSLNPVETICRTSYQVNYLIE